MQLMQEAPSDGQICNLCKWRHLVAKYATNASGAMLLLHLIQVNFWVRCASGNVSRMASLRLGNGEADADNDGYDEKYDAGDDEKTDLDRLGVVAEQTLPLQLGLRRKYHSDDFCDFYDEFNDDGIDVDDDDNDDNDDDLKCMVAGEEQWLACWLLLTAVEAENIIIRIVIVIIMMIILIIVMIIRMIILRILS